MRFPYNLISIGSRRGGVAPYFQSIEGNLHDKLSAYEGEGTNNIILQNQLVIAADKDDLAAKILRCISNN